MTFLLATIGREQVASYLSAVIGVYTIIIIVYVLTSMVLSLGARVPYSRPVHAVLGFLRDVSEPYLSVFRRVIPPLGPFDLSPIVAILVLNFAGGLLVRAIHG